MQPPPLPPVSTPTAGQAIGRKSRFIFNAYLVCFLAEGVLGLSSPLVGETFHQILGFISMLLAMLVILIIGSYRNLRWQPLLIPLTFSIWEGCLFLPLPALLDSRPLLLTMALAQSLIGTVALFHLRLTSGGESYLFQEKDWARRQFSVARTLRAAALKLLVLLPAIILYLLWSGLWMVKKISRGFIQIDASGLYTEARDYERDGRVVHLLPTVHIAAPAFYDSLMETLPASQTVILPEGVTDKNHLLKAGLDYHPAADSVGLSAQPNLVEKHSSPKTHPCDADVADFAPATIEVINGIALAMQSASAGDSLGALQALSLIEDKDTATIIDDVIQTRNARVLAGIRTTMQQYSHIAVPWGAAHMPGIEREILKMQFRPTATRRVQVFAWKDLKLPTSQ